jgi:hypothetical protein
MEYKHYIKIANNLIITEKFTLQDFMQTKYYQDQDFSMFFWLDGWFIIDDYTVGVGLVFHDDLIDRVFLYFKCDTITSQKDKIPLYNSYIEKHPEYGDATAEYDSRSNMAQIIIDMQDIPIET